MLAFVIVGNYLFGENYMKILFFSFIFSINHTIAAESLKSHVHGALHMGMAVEKNEVEITIDGPSESLLGFEHAPKTEKEKKIYLEAENNWKTNLSSFVIFESHLQCKQIESSFKQHKAGKHSDIEASAKFVCAKDVSPSTVHIALKKTFKHIKKLSVEVVSQQIQRIEIKEDSKAVKL